MLKSIQPYLFSFDVEWVPDPLSAELLHGIKSHPPQSYEDAFRVLWADAGATDENPQPYLKTVLCRIVSIAGIFRGPGEDGQTTLKLISLPANIDDPEKCKESALLNGFLKAVGGRHPQLVGYNSSGADVPIIVQRGILHGLPGFGFAKRPDKPWEGVDYFSTHSDHHVDLGEIMGRWGQMPRLHEAAILSGIPGKMGVSGDSVAQMWLAGDLQGIVNYNEYDAFTTHLLWARVAHFAELLSDENYEREQQLIQELLEAKIAEGHKHLQAYLEEWIRLREKVKSR